MVYILKGNYLTNFVHCKPKNLLASDGPNGDNIATPSICLYNILSNIKYDFLVAKDRRFLNALFFKP